MKLLSIKVKTNSVVLDLGNYKAEIDQSDFSDLKLVVNDEISPAKHEQIDSLALDYKLKKQAIAYVSRSLKTKKQLEIYLKRKGAGAQKISEISYLMEQIGLINDENYASSFISTKLAIKPSSSKKLYFDLQAKGIDKAIAESAIKDIGVDEETNLKNMITKKQKLTKYKDKRKLAEYLYRQGFSYSLVKKELF